MSCKQKSIKLSLAIVFGVVALSFIKAGMDNRAFRSETPGVSFLSVSHSAPVLPGVTSVSQIAQANSEPLAYLFQIMFFLFIISPPIIAVMLFLIWKELKKRNDLK